MSKYAPETKSTRLILLSDVSQSGAIEMSQVGGGRGTRRTEIRLYLTNGKMVKFYFIFNQINKKITIINAT